jgi:regulatory protein
VVDEATARDHEERAVESARELALSLLTRRDRTRAEIATALERRGVPPEIGVRVLDRLGAVGLLDDRAVAEAYAEREAGRKGPRAIADALRRRGIEPALVREVAYAVSSDQAQGTALSIARQKLPTWGDRPRPVLARRLAGFLARRGFAAGTVNAVVREVLGELDGLDPSAG